MLSWIVDVDGPYRGADTRLMSEHTLMAWALVGIGLEVLGVALIAAYYGYKTWKTSERLEGLIAAIYLEAKRALSQPR